ncbi:MAG: ribosome maturation factor RimM [Legionellales bacterium]
MNDQANWVVVGRFGRPHGIKGFITVHSFTEPRDNILAYTDWHVYLHSQWQPVRLLSAEAHSKNLIAQVEGYPERELVAGLTNAQIAVQKEQLAKLDPGEYYWHQLIGMRVVNPKGELLGVVADIMATGAHDVLIVQGEKRHFIPYVMDRFILDIDDNQKTIRVDWDTDF